MKFIQNSAFLILFLFISGCGLIIDIACLATGRPGTQKPDSEKTDFERSMDKTRNEQDNWVRDQQRKFEEERVMKGCSVGQKKLSKSRKIEVYLSIELASFGVAKA